MADEQGKEKPKQTVDYSFLKSPCCLIAEDSPTIQKYYSAILTKMKVNFIIGGNGKEALLHLDGIDKADIKLDFMIIDIMMPEMDGIELMTKIKEMPSFSNTPLMVASALSDKKTALEVVKNFQPVAYLVKPLEMPQFVKAVQGILTKKED